jgi:hypothetical protein
VDNAPIRYHNYRPSATPTLGSIRYALLATLFIVPLCAKAQESKRGLGLDLGLSPSFVFSDRVEADNWIGSKPLFGASLNAAINWSFPKDRAALGLGGGLFLWGDRVLYPVFLQLAVDPSVWCDDCFFNRGIWLRTTVDLRLGTMIGRVETTAGPLRPDFFSEMGIRYRLGTNTRSRFHAGMRLSTFTLRGPYQMQVEGVWEDSKPSFLTVGPALWVTF